VSKYPITQESKDKEKQTRSAILRKNHYSKQEMHLKQRRTPNREETQKPRWATFTYYGSEIRTITKLFKNTNVKIAYKTINTIENHLKPRLQVTDIYEYNQSGVYQLKCKDCPLKYIGKTGRTFKTRYNEHIYAIKTNRRNSKYAEHILDTGHTHGTINETLDILHTKKKGHLLDTLERYYIYNLSKQKLHMNDTYADKHNPIFELIINNTSTSTPPINYPHPKPVYLPHPTTTILLPPPAPHNIPLPPATTVKHDNEIYTILIHASHNRSARRAQKGTPTERRQRIIHRRNTK
jgi:hypothetical protein